MAFNFSRNDTDWSWILILLLSRRQYLIYTSAAAIMRNLSKKPWGSGVALSISARGAGCTAPKIEMQVSVRVTSPVKMRSEKIMNVDDSF